MKLNGGLGTTMGCQGPKSVISVRSGLTFLDLTIQQLEVKMRVRFVISLSIFIRLATESNLRLRCSVSADEFVQYTRRNGENLTEIQSCLGQNLRFQSIEVSHQKGNETEVIGKCFFPSFRYPRVDRETLLPIGTNVENSENECWYPPGHGDVYQSFYNSGLLDQFIEQGKEYMFLSNIDNLGATVDLCKTRIQFDSSRFFSIYSKIFSSIY